MLLSSFEQKWQNPSWPLFLSPVLAPTTIYIRGQGIQTYSSRQLSCVASLTGFLASQPQYYGIVWDKGAFGQFNILNTVRGRFSLGG